MVMMIIKTEVRKPSPAQLSTAQDRTANKPRLKLPTANTQWQEGTLLFSPQSTNMAVSPRNHSHHDWRDRGQAWSSATEYLPQMYLARQIPSPHLIFSLLVSELFLWLRWRSFPLLFFSSSSGSGDLVKIYGELPCTPLPM